MLKSRQAMTLYAVFAVFVCVFGSKLLLIRYAGSSLPYWDQWDAEGNFLYKPFQNASLRLSDFFTAHNEHRIFFTRVLNLGLLIANGQWDAQLEMFVNAFLHTVLIATFCLCMFRGFGERYGFTGCIVAAILYAIPFSWENTIAGFQSPFYFLFGFSVFSIWLLISKNALSFQWFFGVCLAIFGIFTLASGWFAACSVLAVLVIRGLRIRQEVRRHLPTLIVCGLIVAFGIALTVRVPGHDLLKAHSLGEFLSAFGKSCTWPISVSPFLALLAWLPWMILLRRYWLYAKERSSKNEILLCFGVWTLMQSAAVAYARGAGAAGPSSRYLDALAFGVMVNALCLVRILETPHVAKLQMKMVQATMFAMFIVLHSVGAVQEGLKCFQEGISGRKDLYQKQQENVRDFLKTDDFSKFSSHPFGEIPYPDAQSLAERLRDPYIRSILPVSVRPPVKIFEEPQIQEGFSENALPPTFENPYADIGVLGNYSPSASSRSRFTSAVYRPSHLPYFEIEAAGWLGMPGTKLQLVSVQGQILAEIKPKRKPHGGWFRCIIEAPKEPYVVRAECESPSSWFAFTPPREVGRLSLVAQRIVNEGGRICLWMLGILAVFPLYTIFRYQQQRVGA